MLREPAVLDHALATERFEMSDGELAVPDELLPLEPQAEDPLAELPGFVRATLGELDTDPGAAARVLAAAEGLGGRVRDWLELRIAWHAHRARDFDRRDALLDALDVRRGESSAAIPFRATVLAALLLAADSGRALPSWAMELAPRLDDQESLGLGERLRARDLAGPARELERAHAAVAAHRVTLRTVRTVLPIVAAATAPMALPVGSRLVLYHPIGAGAGVGAGVEPRAFVARLRDAGDALVVPWSGRLRLDGNSSDSTFDVVPGLLALQPDSPRIDRSGLVGFALVLTACAAIFVGSLAGMRRGVRRETDALRTRAEFLTSVTHELKTPLAAIRLLAERLREGRVRGVEKQQEYYALLAGETARLTTLIENVLDLGRMERGERSYDKHPVAIDEVAGEAAALFEPLARASGLEFRFVPDAAGVRTSIDRGAIVQTVLNLLDNARKYGQSGGTIELSTAAFAGACAITVRDHGPGVPIAERAMIFERFTRGSAHRNGAVPGVGLGLHLARTIARAHGGELVYMEPDDGAGTGFVLRLPRLAAECEADANTALGETR